MNEATAQTTLRVKVVPGASNTEIMGWLGRRLKIRVAETAQDGQANKALTQYLAKQLDLPPTAVAITHGQASPHKTLTVNGFSLVELTERFRTLTKAS